MLVPKFTGIIPPVPKTFNNGHWIFTEQMCKGLGFVYIVRDVLNQRFYIGKKYYFGQTAATKHVESNWKKYKTSSKELNEMIGETHTSAFEFICLEQYSTKATVSYSETWSLCSIEAPTRKDFYNVNIEKVSWQVKELITQRHRARLRRALLWEDMRTDEEDM